MATLWSRLMAGFTAFREAYLSAGLLESTSFTDFDARRMRYALYWAFYENTAYRNLHNWAVTYRQQQALYRYIRGVYNPAYRLGEFWKAHLWGGRLDLEAGDGKDTPSALPIVTDNDDLRPAISQVWRWSNWQIAKQTVPLYGSIMGDVVLQVVDDVKRKKVYLQPLHPGILKDVEIDAWGNVKGYEIEERRPHPQRKDTLCTYGEKATRDGDNVVYQTLLDGKPYAWQGDLAEWQEPYGFIPMVFIQHNNVGLDFGWSELHAGRAKFQEVDDLASKLSDQIRKAVDAPWLFTGVDKPRSLTRASGELPTMNAPAPGREETPVIYAPQGASAQALVAPLDIAAAGQYISSILAEIERDYPELQMDIWSAGGNATGRALRVARQRVTTKVSERRAIYDDSLARAQMMAVSIGGFRGYEGFGGFGLDSYEKGDLDHSIGERPIFEVDPLDDIETEAAFWQAANAAIKAGMPLVTFLKRQGWAGDDIKELENSEEYKARMQSIKLSTMMAGGLEADEQEGGNPEANNNQSVEEEEI